MRLADPGFVMVGTGAGTIPPPAPLWPAEDFFRSLFPFPLGGTPLPTPAVLFLALAVPSGAFKFPPAWVIPGEGVEFPVPKNFFPPGDRGFEVLLSSLNPSPSSPGGGTRRFRFGNCVRILPVLLPDEEGRSEENETPPPPRPAAAELAAELMATLFGVGATTFPPRRALSRICFKKVSALGHRSRGGRFTMFSNRGLNN